MSDVSAIATLKNRFCWKIDKTGGGSNIELTFS